MKTHHSNKQLEVRLISIVVTLIEIMRSLRRNKKQSFELKISLGAEVTPGHRLAIAKVLQFSFDVRNVSCFTFLQGIKLLSKGFFSYKFITEVSTLASEW